MGFQSPRGIRVTTKPKRVFIAGCKGLLGTPTTARFKNRPDTVLLALGLPEIDITHADQVRKHIETFQPNLVINCAAYTKVDDCETNEELATKINGEGAGTLAREAARLGAGFVHVSTDYVFDGNGNTPYTEDQPTAPPEKLSAYGRSKLIGEQQVIANHPKPLIVRTAWLYGPSGPGFPQTILRLAKEHPSLKIVNDQTGTPTYAPDLAEALYKLTEANATGLVHFTNAGSCTWYEFAREILRLAELRVPVEPVSTAEFPRPAKRPAYSVLSPRRYAALTGSPPRPWQQAIAEFLRSTRGTIQR